MSALSREDVAVLKATFKKYDKNHTGTLSLCQFTLFLSRLSKHVTELRGIVMQEAAAAFNLLDCDRDGALSFEEFCDWWARGESERYSYFIGDKGQLLKKAYAMYIKYTLSNSQDDQPQPMTYDQFERMMEELGLPHSEYDFDDLDQDDDGLLTFDEFCEWLNWF